MAFRLQRFMEFDKIPSEFFSFLYFIFNLLLRMYPTNMRDIRVNNERHDSTRIKMPNENKVAKNDVFGSKNIVTEKNNNLRVDSLIFHQPEQQCIIVIFSSLLNGKMKLRHAQ